MTQRHRTPDSKPSGAPGRSLLAPRNRFLPVLLVWLLVPSGGSRASAQPAETGQSALTSPLEFFGHEVGADYVLPNYRQLVEYWQILEAESDRMRLTSIGETTEGRQQYMAILTSPANHANLDRYRAIARRLALADGLTDEEARALAAEGKAVVWIDGGLHATEVLGSQQLIETVWQLVSRDDPENLRILEDVIVLVVHANPDGHDLVADWYTREPVPERRTSGDIPRLYQYYIGHDNNRDFYASTQMETTNMNRVLYREWFPQILYNHHQTGPVGSVIFAPPFRDPFNYVFHPLIVTGLDLVGAAMHNRYVAEDKPGAVMTEGASYSTWWNGGLRTTAYFHNVIGLLTEAKGNPTPVEIPFIPALQLPNADMPFPIAPHQTWHFRQSIEYELTANYAVMDIASRYRETFLYNMYRMAADNIDAGSRDSWTVYPKRMERVRAALEEAQLSGGGETPEVCSRVREGMPYERQRPCTAGDEGKRFYAMLQDPELRDPRGYIIPADQADFATATRFVQALQKTGVTVHRATAPFSVDGRGYPSGSYVVMTAQAYRPHILDLFEPQDHPNDFEYPGGPPIHPYDAAGWTLAYQMGVRFDRVLDGFTGPFEVIEELAEIPPGSVGQASDRVAGYLVSPAANDAFRAAARVLEAGGEAYRLHEAWEQAGTSHAPGSFYFPSDGPLNAQLRALADEFGLFFAPATTAPPDDILLTVQRPRIGVFDVWGGSMPSGWVRWILDQFEIPYDVVFVQRLDAGNLSRDFDVLVFADGTIPEGGGRRGSGPDPSSVPSEWQRALGQFSLSSTVPQIQEFARAGGTIVTIGSSTALAQHLDVPVRNHLLRQAEDGTMQPLPGEQYFIPASVLQVRVDSTHPLAWGMGERVDVLFDNSPVFDIGGGGPGMEPVAWFDGPEPLRSGWAWGQHHLEGGVAVATARVGDGALYLFGPEILYRGQPHGTFKFFFNALYNGTKD